jgi:AFG3 family protein
MSTTPGKPTPPASGGNNQKPNIPKFSVYWVYGILILIFLGFNYFNSFKPQDSAEITEQDFVNNFLIKNWIANPINIYNGQEVEATIKVDSLSLPAVKKYLETRGIKYGKKPPVLHFNILSEQAFAEKFSTLATQYNLDCGYKPSTRGTWTNVLIQLIFPILILVVLYTLMTRKMGSGGGMGGGGIFNIGKSRAQLYEKGGTKVDITFNDVAGLDEAKVEVMEIVDFLKNPKKYTALGGKIPKGCLLVGPPGTGKTLLAKAMAGEAQVPFFSMSGSDFVEMFVGVGASRVRDLFKQAREKSPCIIFIDEIDAIGRARGRNAVATNDERENTLNQMLVEMDGFSGDSGIIVLAATNRPDVLDSALLRPGRFDRQIGIDIPDLAGREQIFRVHLKGIKTAAELDIHKLAEQTPGFAGADIANVCNEAALIAARKGKTEVYIQDFNDAVDRVIGGLEKKNKIISPDEKKVIAYHEAGHAVSGWFLEHAYPLVKVTIVPRGEAALGYAQYLPKEKYLTTREEIEDRMCMALGGRVSEEIMFDKISTGALSDLQSITKMAYSMVSVYGMNDKVGNISFYDPQNEGSFTKPYSEETGKMIDSEVRNIVDQAYSRTKKLLLDKIEAVKIIAEELLVKEVLYKEDLERLIGIRPFQSSEEPVLIPVTVPTQP